MRLRLDTSPYGDRVATVTLSRRNLLALLLQLELPQTGHDIHTQFDCPPGWILVVASEDDDQHYAGRAVPPGPMHPRTEAVIARVDPAFPPADDEEGGATSDAKEPGSSGPDIQDIAHGDRDPGHEPDTIRQSTLWQGTYWWDRQARRHAIERMPRDYLLNVMSFLERRAAEFFLSEFGLELLDDLAGKERPVDAPRAREVRDPLEWLRATPLMQALAEAAARQVDPSPSAKAPQSTGGRPDAREGTDPEPEERSER